MAGAVSRRPATLALAASARAPAPCRSPRPPEWPRGNRCPLATRLQGHPGSGSPTVRSPLCMDGPLDSVGVYTRGAAARVLLGGTSGTNCCRAPPGLSSCVWCWCWCAGEGVDGGLTGLPAAMWSSAAIAAGAPPALVSRRTAASATGRAGALRRQRTKPRDELIQHHFSDPLRNRANCWLHAGDPVEPAGSKQETLHNSTLATQIYPKGVQNLRDFGWVRGSAFMQCVGGRRQGGDGPPEWGSMMLSTGMLAGRPAGRLMGEA